MLFFSFNVMLFYFIAPLPFKILSKHNLSSGQKEEKLANNILQLIVETQALEPLNCPPFPEVNSFFDVFVTYAASPSHFAVSKLL